MFAAATAGMDATGIELLPSSVESIAVRHLLMTEDTVLMADALCAFRKARPWESQGPIQPFAHITITKGAFPDETERQLGRFLHEADNHPLSAVGRVLRFAALCVLESISYTRKDGQYLRWDHRSGRRQGAKPFDKGAILSFTEAIESKLRDIESDLCASEPPLTLFDTAAAPVAATATGEIRLLAGSCLDILPGIHRASIDGIVTSPPYANRYDYTRTYALELAMLGVGEEEIRRLRQAMLSCTVENKAKEYLANRYAARDYCAAMTAFEEQPLLHLILTYLEQCKADKTLNNAGIPRMVRNYFAEMALVIFECARVLKSGSSLIMVNDNVRYMAHTFLLT